MDSRPKVLRCDSGGEKWIPYLVHQLERMEQAAVVGIREMAAPDGSKLRYRRGLAGNWVWIERSGGTFIVTPYMRAPTGEVVQQGSEYLDIGKGTIVPTDPVFSVVRRYVSRPGAQPVVVARTAEAVLADRRPGYFANGVWTRASFSDQIAQITSVTNSFGPIIYANIAQFRDSSNNLLGAFPGGLGGSAGAPLDFSADGLTFFHNDSTGAYRVIRLNPALLPTAIIASSTVFPVTGIDPPYGSLTTVLNTIINVGGTGSQSYDYESVVSVGLRADGVPAVTTVRVQQTTNTTYAIIFAGSAPIASTEYLRSLNDSKTVTVTTGWGATITATTNTFTSLDNLQVGYPIGPFTVTHEAVASGASEDLEILWVDPMAKVLVFKKIREEFLFGTDTPPFGLLDSTSIDVAKTRIVTYNILLDAKVVELSRTTTSIVPPDSAGRESVGGLTNATGSSTVTEDWNDAYIPFRNPRTSVADGTAAIVAVTNDLGQYLVQYCPNLDAIPVIYGSKDPKPMLVKRFREIIAARTPSPSNTQILNDIDSNNLSAYRFALTAPSGGPMMDCVG